MAAVSTPNPSFVKTKQKINWSGSYWWDELFIEKRNLWEEQKKGQENVPFNIKIVYQMETNIFNCEL